MRRGILLAVLLCALAAGLVMVTRVTRDVAEERAPATGERELSADDRQELERLATLGYISGRAPATDDAGVLVHDASKSAGGYTLFTFAKGPEAVLIDMDGRQLHAWSLPGSSYWARAHVFPNGDLLAMTCDPYRLIKLNRDSELIWTTDEPAHHDFEVRPDGTIWVLVREATTREDIHDGVWILDDVLVHLDATGNELGRVSLLESFERSAAHAGRVKHSALPEGSDIFHTNSLEIQPGGRRALVSIRELSIIAMLDLEAMETEWVLEGSWRKQHEAQMLDGRVLMFDNLGLGEQSRVIEADSSTGAIGWVYSEPEFFSRGSGAQERLANGNTLISESESGRIIEVTREGEVVWEFINPRTVPDRPSVTLGITRAVRVPADLPVDWVRG